MNPSLRGTQPTQLLSLEDTSALLNFNEETCILNYKTMGGNTFKSILLSFVSKITKKHTTFFFFFDNSEVSRTACYNQ